MKKTRTTVNRKHGGGFVFRRVLVSDEGLCVLNLLSQQVMHCFKLVEV